MPYNVRLKKYKNGTFQLTYYHRAIRTKDDYWRPYNLPDLHTTDYDDEDEEFDIDKWIELKPTRFFFGDALALKNHVIRAFVARVNPRRGSARLCVLCLKRYPTQIFVFMEAENV